MPNLTADLAYWITERYSIKLRREAGLKKPWSEDRVMQSVRFCNVHREDDKVTKWMRENWSDCHSPVWWFVLGRMLNYIPTLEDIVFYGVDSVDGTRGPDSLPTIEGLSDGLKARRESGEKVFTSVYTISTCGKKMDKIDYVLGHVISTVKRIEETGGSLNRPTLSSTADALTSVDGLGSFLAGQVIADMKNTQGHYLQEAEDWWTWSTHGPGSLRGLSWYFFNEPDRVTAGSYQRALDECRREVDPLIPDYIPRISNQDFQNCLCEFSKYIKVKRDPNAHVRNTYDGS